MSALLQLKERRQLGERAALARFMRVAINGDPKVFAGMIRKLEDESE